MVLISTTLARAMEKQGSGSIVNISSVGGVLRFNEVTLIWNPKKQNQIIFLKNGMKPPTS
jgi:hypothetical protein